jgi:hypothetical protein
MSVGFFICVDRTNTREAHSIPDKANSKIYRILCVRTELTDFRREPPLCGDPHRRVCRGLGGRGRHSGIAHGPADRFRSGGAWSRSLVGRLDHDAVCSVVCGGGSDGSGACAAAAQWPSAATKAADGLGFDGWRRLQRPSRAALLALLGGCGLSSVMDSLLAAGGLLRLSSLPESAARCQCRRQPDERPSTCRFRLPSVP